MDAEQFDGLARTVAERGEERARDREHFDTLSRLVAAKGSRRVALAGLLGAVLGGQGAQPAAAGCRSKEGKNKRQCRRHHRKEKAPGATGRQCPDNRLNWIGRLCGSVAGSCCPGMTCTPTLTIAFESCQFPCQRDQDCVDKFNTPAEVRCKKDVFACPFLPDAKCCRKIECRNNSDCGRDYHCEFRDCVRGHR